MTAIESQSMHEVAEARLHVYRFLHAALDKPTPDQHAWMQRPEFLKALALVCNLFGLHYPDEEAVPHDYADFESRYLACFEVGVPAPPVPLQASSYNRREPVPAVIHEHVLFYKRFGLQQFEDAGETADHLINELAFLTRLDELLTTSRTTVDSVLLARRDFLKRHLARWAPRAAADAEEKRLPAVYRTLLALLARAVEQDLELTSAASSQHTTEEP
jgi:DMSO reductase family type II enzyme chaperone